MTNMLTKWAFSIYAAAMIVAVPGTSSARTLPAVKPVIACTALAETDITAPGEAPARIVTAKLVSTGVPAPYCEVRGYVAPQIKFELRLPTENWMQRLMFSGCGGFCGRVDFRIRASEGCAAVENGEFALVASDLGHDTPDGNGDTVWAANNRQGKIDYGYRAVHVVTAAAKQIVARFYGQAQAYAYFNGCSDGGREGMMEVQRYPDDFDGVIAGAPVMNDTANNTIMHAWAAQKLQSADGALMFQEEDIATLHAGALGACDTTGDGVKDGIIGDPLACKFDPKSIECRDGNKSGCLTSEQVQAARALYTGPVDADGRVLYFGRPIGSELAWGGPEIVTYARSFVSYMMADEPQEFELSKFGYDAESLKRYNALASIYNATEPDIRAFEKSGGKLIMWHGFSDPAVPPASSVAYYREMLKAVGATATEFTRLYMLPGVGHCGGGEGADKVNFIDAIIAWVEDGIAPDAIQTARKNYGRTIFSRPLFPYPEVAKYAGNPNAATSFKRQRSH